MEILLFMCIIARQHISDGKAWLVKLAGSRCGGGSATDSLRHLHVQRTAE